MTDEKMKHNGSAAAFVRRRKRKRMARVQTVRQIFFALASVLTGFLFSGARFPFDTYPLSAALACSAERYVICTVLGVFLRLAVSYSRGGLYLPAVLCVSGAALRYAFYISSKKAGDGRGSVTLTEKLSIRDDISRRALISLALGLAWSLVRALSGRTFYDLFAGVFFTLALLVFTFLFSFARDVRFKNTSAGAAGGASFVFCAVFALSGVNVLTVSLGLFAAYAITLCTGLSGDGAKAAVAGLLVGLAAGGEHAVIFAFAGLAAGIFSDLSPYIAAGVPLVGGACALLYMGGGEGLLSALPEMLLASILVVGAAKLGVLPRVRFDAGEKSELRISGLIAKKKDEENESRARERAAMLSSLSSMIKNMSQVFRAPDKQSISDMCREVFAKYCADCPRAAECKKAKEREEDVVDSIAARIMKNGRSAKNGEILRFGCLKKDSIVREINERTAAMMRESDGMDKSNVFAFDYGTAAKIIADTVAKSETAYAVDKEATERLFSAFENSGIICDNLVVCGDRKKYIIATGRDILRSGASAQEIRTLCAAVCGGSFTLPTYSLDGANASMTLERTRTFEVEYAGRQSAKKGERVCGDAFGATESREDFFYGFICDGMGSGPLAGATAGLCKTFLTQMLSYGNKKSTTLEMLNMFISSKNTECFSTADLLEIDLIEGKACFVKSGAAASYVVRRGDVFKIASGTVPLGILTEVNAEITEFALCDGDVIVMCSDGACTDTEKGEEECEMKIAEFLEHEWRLDACKLAEKLLSEVNYRSKRADDVSICVFRIKRVK